MERIGIYGGTFNPPHIGHLQAARHAVRALGLSKLLLIPDRIAPHKLMPQGSPTPWQRLEMVEIAASGEEKLVVSDMELMREGKSYTCDTVAALAKQYPEAKLYLIMGTDMFLSFQTWKNPEEIVKRAALAVLYRGQAGEREQIEECAAKMRQSGTEVVTLLNPVTEISSTQLRRMLVMGCGDSFLPKGVGAYIAQSGLYGVGKNYRGLSMEALEQVVVSLLNPNRVAHVLGCRDTAVALAKRYGADERNAARAGLLHDITKALDGSLQLTLCSAYGVALDTFSSQNPKTLHALTGSLVAERIFGENGEIVSAIACHTTGKANMNLLEKILYVADYIEPNRDFPGVERLRELAFADITKALRLGLEMTLSMLKSQSREISPESQEALQYLENSGITL